MLGAYGPWAAGLVGEGPARLSFRDGRVPAGELEAWRKARGSGFVIACFSLPRGQRRKPRCSISLTTMGFTSST